MNSGVLMRRSILFVLVAAVLLSAPAAARAQADEWPRKFEVGFVLTGLDIQRWTGEGPVGVGGRFTYNLGEYAALDAELVHYPESSGNFGETQGLLGVKAGRRFGRVIGVFAKARPGFLKLGPAVAARTPALGETRFALDLGGVVELYPSRRSIVRVDVGDTIIPLGDTPINSALRPPRSFGTTHNKQTTFGIGYRF